MKKWFKKLFNFLERPWPFFFTFHLRPKKAGQVNIIADKLVVYPKVAIVIQGPIVYDQDFTLETVRLYKKIFPYVVIILSTWNYEQADYIKKIANEGIEILLNQPPSQAGQQNINYQIVSASAGVKRAKEMGVEYVLKTRTDIRIYEPNSIEFLLNITNNFLPKNNDRQKNRIVGVSLNSFKYRLYGLSDINLFGTIEDMGMFWDVNLDDHGSTFKNMKLGLCEVYLTTEYLKKLGYEIKWTLVDSWRAFAENFCIVDEQSLDMYWYKYARMKEYRYVRYGEMRNDQEMTFREWFNVYSNLQNKDKVDLVSIKKIIP